MIGTLLIRPQNAKLLHDTEFIGKMSPYLRVTAGAQTVNSPICRKGHLTPTWDCELRVVLNGTITFLVFELFNKEHFSKDDLIGSAQFSLNEVTAQGFRGWIPLVYNGGDAGALFTEILFMPEEKKTPTLQESISASMLKHVPIFKQGTQQTTMVVESPLPTPTRASTTTTGVTTGVTTGMVAESQVLKSQILEPIIHKGESVITKEEPIIYYERPIVHEKVIITEKPIITEKTYIYCEQPIIVEKPEIHERVIYQREQPVVYREEPVIIREQPLSNLENLERYGPPLVQKETEYRKETPIITRETPILYQQQLITEKPIIIEKDIIHLEKPVYVEKPEIHERPVIREAVLVTEQANPVVISEVTKGPLPSEMTPEIQTETRKSSLTPVYQKERPEIFEKNIIVEKPIIREQPIIYAEQQVVQERPEIRERRIYHQEPAKIIQEEVIILHDDPKP